MESTEYKLTLSQLKVSGVKILKSILSGQKPYNYNKLSWSYFKNGSNYIKFKDKLNIHDILAEIFQGSAIVEDKEYDMGWENLTDKEKIIYKNFAYIILRLRTDIEQLDEEVSSLRERLDDI
jgi:hypothetical protein